MPHALISGASIAGLSSAFWLQRAGWSVTVVERSGSFRDGGQNVDVRGIAREVLDRMGLTGEVSAQNTTEQGTVFVDANDQTVGEFPLTGPDGPTAELEILRGDLARIILVHLPRQPQMVYGDHITAVHEQNKNRGVDVELASGQRLQADLLVVAEGVRSATRDLLFSDEVERHELGINMAFGTIPRQGGDGHFWRWYTATEGRQAMVRPDNKGTIRALLAFTSDQNLAEMDRRDALLQMRSTFADAGWKVPRILDGFDASDDVYIDYLTQIRLPSWSKDHVCLVGDAAWCVTPIGGRGSSLALTAGYVLAAYLSQADLGDLGAALERYEEWMRPPVDQAQALPPGVPRIAYPQTVIGVAVERLVTRAMSTRPLTSIATKLTQTADTDQVLPELHPRSTTH